MEQERDCRVSHPNPHLPPVMLSSVKCGKMVKRRKQEGVKEDQGQMDMVSNTCPILPSSCEGGHVTSPLNLISLSCKMGY